MLNIFLGNRCNFGCDYCLQPKAPIEPAEPDIQKIIDFIQENDIRQIGYWGGEPLLYWDTITRTHNAFLEAGLSFDEVLMITNGSLLDQEIVRYVNEHGFYVVVSEHTRFGQARWSALAAIQKGSINCMITRKNLLLWEFREMIRILEQMFNRPFFLAVGYVRATPDCPDKFYLRPDDVQIHMQHLRELAELKERGDEFAIRYFDQQMHRWKGAFEKPWTGQPLCCNKDKLTIDLAGNVFPCHYCVSPERTIGTLDSYRPGPAVTRHIESAKCQECEAVPWCRGNCYLSMTHEADCLLALEQHRLFKELNDGLPALRP